jgi:hypothetical protein
MKDLLIVFTVLALALATPLLGAAIGGLIGWWDRLPQDKPPTRHRPQGRHGTSSMVNQAPDGV